MRMLVLGGTAWVGGSIAAEAVRRGHEVACLARGSAPAPEGAVLVRADRTAEGAYDAVRDERWDVVLDVARDPVQVRSAVQALSAVGRYVFVSTGNVYADPSTLHLDEDAPLLDPATPSDDPAEAYGRGKVECERAIRTTFGDRALIARAGLIGGPGDVTGRTTYWPWRFAHPSGPAVLVPDAAQRPSEVIDVRDLVAWLVRSTEEGLGGVFNAVGEELPVGEHLAIACAVGGFAGEVVAAPEPWLAQQGVAEWAGPRSLPLWLADPAWQGFAARDGARARAAGLVHRPLEDTLRDGQAWQEAQARPPASGLSDDDERALLALLRPPAPGALRD